MAAPRSQQAHQKRVEKIVAETADKIAQSSPIEEQVIVTIEELPPDEGSIRTASDGRITANGRTTANVSESTRQVAEATEDVTSAWLDLTSAFHPMQMVRIWNPRVLVESSFRFWEELLAVQKDFALKLTDAMPVQR
jgi:hypothetical protein